MTEFCELADCDRQRWCRGLCQRHYQAWQRRGFPDGFYPILMPVLEPCPEDAEHRTYLWADNPRRYFCSTCMRIFGAPRPDLNRWGDFEFSNLSVAQPVA